MYENQLTAAPEAEIVTLNHHTLDREHLVCCIICFIIPPSQPQLNNVNSG
jgi:hypothetical protein